MATKFTTECPSWCTWTAGEHDHAIDVETGMPFTEHGSHLGRWELFSVLRTREDRKAPEGVLSVEKLTLFWNCEPVVEGLSELRALARMVTAAADEFEESTR